jgi:hypothetical protein
MFFLPLHVVLVKSPLWIMIVWLSKSLSTFYPYKNWCFIMATVPIGGEIVMFEKHASCIINYYLCIIHSIGLVGRWKVWLIMLFCHEEKPKSMHDDDPVFISVGLVGEWMGSEDYGDINDGDRWVPPFMNSGTSINNNSNNNIPSWNKKNLIIKSLCASSKNPAKQTQGSIPFVWKKNKFKIFLFISISLNQVDLKTKNQEK